LESYQKAFSEALKKTGGAGAPSGPVWLHPGALPGKKEACTSCHLGVQDPKFLFAAAPFARHSGHFLEDHPPEKFGCTVCHGGQGEGLSFAAAGHAAPANPTKKAQWEQFLGWKPPGPEGMVPMPAVSGRCVLCHSSKALPDGAEPYQAARDLLAWNRCAACHTLRDAPEENVHQAVELPALGSKVGKAWLEGFLSEPHAFRTGTAMPAWRLEAGEKKILVDYLLSLRNPDIGWTGGDPAADSAAVARGRAEVLEHRCQTCHDIPGIEQKGFKEYHKVGPSLARVGEKLNPEWIRHWLADPHKLRPQAGMPHFRLTETKTEIEDLTAFLSSLRNEGASPPAAAPAASGDAAAAGKVAARYHCLACHEIPGLDGGRPDPIDISAKGPEVLARWSGPAGSASLLEGPKALFHRGTQSPRFFDPGQDPAPVLTALAAQTRLPVPAAFVKPGPPEPAPYLPPGEAGKLVEDLRCLSCHTIRGTGGDTGPELTFAGSKLKRDWIVKFLQDPTEIRPMNRARMPKLGVSAREAGILADWIESDLKSPQVEKSAPDFDSAFGFMGQAKIKAPYGCITCHTFGEEGGKVGPELTHVSTRLKNKWIYNWIKNPKHWIPGVRMPNFNMPDEDLLAITKFLSETE